MEKLRGVTNQSSLFKVMLRHAQFALKLYFKDLRYRDDFFFIFIIIIIIVVVIIIIIIVKATVYNWVYLRRVKNKISTTTI